MDRDTVSPDAPVPDARPQAGHVEAGVSLIELLVVVAMLSVLAVGVTLPLRQSANSTQADARLFQSVYARTRAQAVHSGALRGLKVDGRGLRLMQREADGQAQAPRWQLSDQPIRWQGRAVFRATGPQGGGVTAGQSGPRPDILFLPNGQTSAFDLRFTTPRHVPVSCSSDGWSEVSCD